jgi:hypothetical protein
MPPLDAPPTSRQERALALSARALTDLEGWEAQQRVSA